MTQTIKLFRPWVAWASASDPPLPFRLEETNTLCEGGLMGASDTLGAALYALDLVMSLINVRGRSVGAHLLTVDNAAMQLWGGTPRVQAKLDRTSFFDDSGSGCDALCARWRCRRLA